MQRNRLVAIALFVFVAAGLMSYALTYRPPSRARPTPFFDYDQRTFTATRTVTAEGFRLHLLAFRTDGGSVQVDWYDSALAAVTPGSGTYTILTIDGQPVTQALTGSYFGLGEAGPATLRWAGWLPAGEHWFEIALSRVDRSVQVPRVRLGQLGVDSLVVSQEPSG